PTSLSTMIGSFVTGSTISPRIFISTSIVSSGLNCHFSHQAVGKARGYLHRNITADLWSYILWRGEVQNFVLRSPACPLLACLVSSLNHHLSDFANMLLVADFLQLALFFL